MLSEVALKAFVKGVSKTIGSCLVLGAMYVVYHVSIDLPKNENEKCDKETQMIELEDIQDEDDTKYKRLLNSIRL